MLVAVELFPIEPVTLCSDTARRRGVWPAASDRWPRVTVRRAPGYRGRYRPSTAAS